MTPCKHRWTFIDITQRKEFHRVGMHMLYCLRCYEARLAQLTGVSE
jgi:hypothetical protein